ncbi:MAG: class I SAM-dependent methyltransferase [Roseburia sp.]
MYEEIIAQLNPSPKFNLSWYKNEDLYSDGDVEDTIIRLIAENEPEHYIDAIYDNFNWPTYYHLTHLRKNILNWYDFKPGSSVLEIGCGLGAITSVLCEKCGDVTAVELSKRRATGALLRCREKENLEIIVGNLNDIEFEKKFDYITLIGVFEYQGSYTDSENPYGDFLKKIKKLLKPDGKLLIAIENQYGLKYWCGALEDHVGIPFEGMNQYITSKRGVRTFSKAALEKLVKDSGFQNTYFYYPMPDYKLPTVVYSERYLPKNENMQNLQCYYTPDRSTLVADEKGMYRDIIENGVFEFFANSFLVECSDCDEIGKMTFVSLASERKEAYQIATRFTDSGKVEKIALTDACVKKHLRQITENEKAMRKNGVKVWESRWENDKIVSDYLHEPLLEDKVLEAWQSGRSQEIYEVYDLLYSEILKSSEQIGWEENVLYSLGLEIEPDEEAYGPILKVGYLDMILRNAFCVGGEVYWFDQEWILEGVPAKFVLFRGIAQLYGAYPELDDFFQIEALLERYGIHQVYEVFQNLERMFTGLIFDEKQFIESAVFRGGDRAACIENVKKILGLS